ncbi:hypothetical protein, partial [Priestia megaterium]|uniref:hypothetical protein n=1 Tax=Priestia megaterium TaxID=1404 RepID=UPI0035B60A8C
MCPLLTFPVDGRQSGPDYIILAAKFGACRWTYFGECVKSSFSARRQSGREMDFCADLFAAAC